MWAPDLRTTSRDTASRRDKAGKMKISGSGQERTDARCRHNFRRVAEVLRACINDGLGSIFAFGKSPNKRNTPQRSCGCLVLARAWGRPTTCTRMPPRARAANMEAKPRIFSRGEGWGRRAVPLQANYPYMVNRTTTAKRP